jgi:endo-1,3-1,4-beta-glycanase ExoK
VRRSGRLVAVAAAIAVGAGVSVAPAARSDGFRDDFATFDATRWVVIERVAGKGTLEPANVTVADGQLRVTLPGGTLDGGEVRSRGLHRWGTYSVRMKVANAPSSLTAFFLYRPPDYQREIDIELWNDSSRRVMFSTYSDGAQTNTRTTLLPFDATADFHEYTIEYRPGSVRFLVDGTPMQRWSKGVTRSSMHVFVTSWFPSWLEGQQRDADRFSNVEWLEFDAR